MGDSTTIALSGPEILGRRSSLVHLAPEFWGERVAEQRGGKPPPATIPRERLAFPQRAQLVIVEDEEPPEWPEVDHPVDGAGLSDSPGKVDTGEWPSAGQVALAFFGALAVTLALASLVPVGRGLVRSALASLPPMPAAMPAALLAELPLEGGEDRFLEVSATIEPMAQAETFTIKLIEGEKADATVVEEPREEPEAEPTAAAVEDDEEPARAARRLRRHARRATTEQPAAASSPRRARPQRSGLRRDTAAQRSRDTANGDRVGGAALVFERERLELPQTLSRGQVRIGLRRVSSMITNCVVDTSRTAPLSLTIEGRSGRVTAARLSGVLAGTAEGRCVERALSRARFPRFADSALELRGFPLVLR